LAARPGDLRCLRDCRVGHPYSVRPASYLPRVATDVAPDPLAPYRDAPSLLEAEQALIAIERHEPIAELGDIYDELAELAANEGDFALAVRAESRAIELGCRTPNLAREMRGWYLMKSGQRTAGEAEFEALRRELDDDPQLLITLGNARSDSGYERHALSAFDDALTVAKQRGDPGEIARARVERRACREDLGLPPDDDDRCAPRPRLPLARPERPIVAIGWFPRTERAAALSRWPELGEDLADADGYCRRIDARLRAVRAATGRSPCVAPLLVRELLECAEREGLDPAGSRARASLAADVHEQGRTVAWPPGRNEPCWCGSAIKYKRCCGS
jgi:tetratricopeptide (TPR) repeat protein